MRLKVASIAFISLIILLTGVYLVELQEIYIWQATVMPWMAAALTLVFCLVLIIADIKQLRTGRYEEGTGVHMDVASFQDMSRWATYKKAIKNFALIPAIYAGIWLFGFHIAIALFFIVYLIFRARVRWFMVPALTLLMLLFLFYFDKFLNVWWPMGLLGWSKALPWVIYY